MGDSEAMKSLGRGVLRRERADEQDHRVMEGHVLDKDEKIDRIALEFSFIGKPVVEPYVLSRFWSGE
jgi:hypothetical protein